MRPPPDIQSGVGDGAAAGAPTGLTAASPVTTLEVQTCAELAGVLDPSVNLCVWRRPARPEILALARRAAYALRERTSLVVERSDPGVKQAIADFLPQVAWELDRRAASAWRDDVDHICNFFMDLVKAEAAMVVLEGPSEATCPRFHVDGVGIRMLVTYSGPGTEWLDESDVDRRWLGAAGHGLPDDQNGVLRAGAEIRSLDAFSVALFKGEAWPSAEGRGIVHRSPDPCGAPRVLLRVDALDPD